MSQNAFTVLFLAAVTGVCSLSCDSDSSSSSRKNSPNRDGSPMPESARTGGANRYNETDRNRGTETTPGMNNPDTTPR